MNAPRTAGGLFLVVAGLSAAWFGVSGVQFAQFLISCASGGQCAPSAQWAISNMRISAVSFIGAGLVVFVIGALLVWKGLMTSSQTQASRGS